MASRSQQAAKRRNAPPVKQQRPWGLIAAGVAIALFAVSVIGYAATRKEFDPRNPDIAGLVSEESESADHREGAVAYDRAPPMGGPHGGTPQACAVYEAQIPSEYVLHSMEHGAVWLTYRPDLAEAEVAKLRGLVEGNRYRILSPFDGQPSPIVATAWGKQLQLDSTDDPRLSRFLRAFTNGPDAPERGAQCAGNTSTGSLGEPAPEPVTTAPTAPSAPSAPSAVATVAPSASAS